MLWCEFVPLKQWYIPTRLHRISILEDHNSWICVLFLDERAIFWELSASTLKEIPFMLIAFYSHIAVLECVCLVSDHVTSNCNLKVKAKGKAISGTYLSSTSCRYVWGSCGVASCILKHSTRSGSVVIFMPLALYSKTLMPII